MSDVKHSNVKLVKGILQQTSGSFGDMVTTKNGVLYYKGSYVTAGTGIPKPPLPPIVIPLIIIRRGC